MTLWIIRAGDWFESYLKNRTQFCTLNGNKSKPKKVTCGMPQDSCLGPLLFIIYLNDFENSLQYSRVSSYADDTNMTVASNDIEGVTDNARQEMLNLQCFCCRIVAFCRLDEIYL